jgi:hypothetical protein
MSSLNRFFKGKKIKRQKINDSSDKPKCGLCGKRGKLTKTPCCDNWICDDEENYVMFSYARNSCYRNHDRYTLCAGHFNEGHEGNWQDYNECKENFDTEDYVEMRTNEYNFVKLKNPPKFEPTRCAKCNKIIIRADGGYAMTNEGFLCMNCSGIDWSKF